MTADLAEASSITQVLHRHARTRPDQPAITELDFTDEDRPSRTVLTYAQLHRRSLHRADRLRAVLGEGEPVVLLRDSGAGFIVDFLGCMLAGVIPVPAPELRADQDRSAVRLSRLVDDARARYGIGNVTSTSLKALGLRSPDTESVTRGQVSPAGPVSRDDTAYIQYTSGTTDVPRGVVVTHDNILREAEIVGGLFEFSPDSVCVNWLPLFHDFGLVMGLQIPLLHGGQVVLMTPRAFVRDPERWLRAISDFGGTHSPAPNFAYGLCVRKIAPDRRGDLRLDTWRVAPNAAEPIRHETIAGFQAAFGAQGFQPEAMRPCYGLAEATLIATAPRPGDVPRSFAADRENLASGRATPATDDARLLVSCGHPVPGLEVAIVAPDTFDELGDDTVGEVWIAGWAVTTGVHGDQGNVRGKLYGHLRGNPDRRYLRTGDLGFRHDGEIYISGRLKNVVIVRGQNYDAIDLEHVAERAHPSIRPGGAAAFPEDGALGEEVGVVCEVLDSCPDAELPAVAAAVQRGLGETFELSAETIALVRPRSVPKTSSGKVQRAECAHRLRSGMMAVRHRHSLAEDPRRAGGAELRPMLRWLVARAVRVPAAQIDDHAPLSEYGLDSLRAEQLAGELARLLGINVPETLVYDHPTIADLAQALE